PAHVSGSVPVWRKARLKAISCACKRRFDMPDQIGPCEPERFGQGQDGRNGGQTLTSLQHGDECSVEIGLEGLCFLRHSRTLKPPLPDSVERSYRPNSPSPTRSWLNMTAERSKYPTLRNYLYLELLTSEHVRLSLKIGLPTS